MTACSRASGRVAGAVSAGRGVRKARRAERNIMTILAMLSGFILAVALDKNSSHRASIFLHSLFFNNAISMLVYAAFSTFVISCAIVFHTGVSIGLWAWPYAIGQFLTKPIVGLTIVFFLLGAWIGVERARLRRFIDRTLG